MNINEVYIDLVYYTLIIHEINITWRSPLYKELYNDLLVYIENIL